MSAISDKSCDMQVCESGSRISVYGPTSTLGLQRLAVTLQPVLSPILSCPGSHLLGLYTNAINKPQARLSPCDSCKLGHYSFHLDILHLKSSLHFQPYVFDLNEGHGQT